MTSDDALDDALIDAEQDTTFDSGAKRSEIKPAYHLIPPESLERQAKRFSMGADKYGILNYLRGLNDPAFVRQILDHMQAHLSDYILNGCKNDDNLAAIMWGCSALCVVEAHNPSILDDIIGARSKAIADALAAPRPAQPLYEGTAALKKKQLESAKPEDAAGPAT